MMKITIRYKNNEVKSFLLNLSPGYLLESKTIDNGCLYNSLDEYKAHNKPLWYELLYTDSHFQSAIQISMCLVVAEYGPRYKC